MSSERPPKFKTGAPWYRNREYYRYAANAYLSKFLKLKQSPDHKSEFKSFSALSSARLVFESNLIEGAGLPSEGETRKLIQKNFPVLPGRREDYTPLLVKDGDFSSLLTKARLKDMRRIIQKSGLPPEKIVPSISFAGQSREFREVLQHYQALRYYPEIVLEWAVSALMERVRDTIKFVHKGDPEQRDLDIREFRKAIGVERIVHKRMFTHTNLKRLHRILAHGLMPDDAGVPAGKYRIDSRSVGWDIAFPAPELVQESMNNFVRKSDELLMDLYYGRSEMDCFQLAAEISYHFVRIHPFPDFNGRLSRIIMNIVLESRGCPFPIAIRGDGKGRKRYFTALRHANSGNMKSLEALVAMEVVEAFRGIDDNLKLAGLSTIWSVEIDEEESPKATKK